MGRSVYAVALACACACGCGHPPAPEPHADRPAAVAPLAPPGDAADPSQEERLAAIQKAMNELDDAAQQCWAVAATQRFDVEGELTAQIEVARGGSKASVVRDTVQNTALLKCLLGVLSAYHWAPPLDGQTLQLPFKFRAPDGQNTIDRGLVPWSRQGPVSVAVLLDENNTGNDAASMFELAIAAGGTTGLRWADRAELWYFLGDARVTTGGHGAAVAAGDMMYAPRGSAREVAATAGDLHAVVVMVPGGREGAARGGALPTREVTGGAKSATAAVILPAAGARTYGPATIYADAAVIPDKTLAASILVLPSNGRVAEHVHASETEVLYVLAGSGTMTVNGVALAVTPSSVVQIPKNTRHAFAATSDVRAVQIYTPAGPEQRFKAHP